MAEKSLIFYSLSTCGYCEITKKMLDDLEVEYEAIVVDLLPLDKKEKTVQEIKKYNPTIEVIMLTGHGGGIPLTGAHREKHGPFDCVMKPADIKELTTKINQAMAKRQTAINRGKD